MTYQRHTISTYTGEKLSPVMGTNGLISKAQIQRNRRGGRFQKVIAWRQSTILKEHRYE